MQNYVLWSFIITLAVISFFETLLCSGNHMNMVKNAKFHRNIYILICAALIVLYIFKFEFSGVDDYNYYFNWYLRSYSWKDIVSDSLLLGNDGGYKFIVKLCKLLGCDYWLQCAVVFIFTLVPIFYVIFKKSNYYIFSVFLYSCFYWNQSFFLHRIALALSLCFLGWMMIDENRYFKAVIIIWFASTVHISAVIAWGFFIIKRISDRIFWQYVVGGIILGGMISYRFMPQIAAFYQSGRYLHQMNYNGGLKLILVMLFVCIFAKAITNKYLKEKTNSFSYKIMCASLPLQMLSMRISVFVRMVYIYFLHLIIVFPNMLYDMNKKNRLIISIGLLIGGILWVWYIGENLNSISWYFQKRIP